ncbi:MAG: D-aminoacylase [Fidelibacterota bacterium]
MKRLFFYKGVIMVLMLIFSGCSDHYDIVIANGNVLDGSGKEAKKTDIGIRGNKITGIGNLSGKNANLYIDASDRIVAPGFIDPHSHTDTKLLINSRAESKIRQGVTTEITGNCGYSPFPQKSRDKSMWSSANAFSDYKSYCDTLAKHGIAINQASLVGHGNIRRYVMGNVDAEPDPEQLDEMKELLDRQLRQGAWGMSTGLEYTPGSFASTEELIELAKVLKKYDAIYATHMRNEDEHLVEAVDEAIRIARESGVRVQISHFKACNQPCWPLIDVAIEHIRDAREEGLRITADRYPYNAYSTSLAVFLPTWARAGNDEDVIARLKDPANDAEFREYAEGKFKRIGGYERFLVSGCKNERWASKTVAEGMAETGLSGYDYVKMVLLEDIHADMIGFAMDEDNLKKVLKEDFVTVCSDASAYAPYGKLGEGKQHPRAYGSNVRVLGKYVREENVLDLPTAVYKMSGQVAEIFGIPQRGFLKKGYYADIVVFDPETVIDKATYSDPHQYPEGIDHVFVNGVLTVTNDTHTGVSAGSVLRKK